MECYNQTKNPNNKKTLCHLTHSDLHITSLSYVPIQAHVKTHSDEYKFNCRFCNAQFMNRNSWQTHQKNCTVSGQSSNGVTTVTTQQPQLPKIVQNAGPPPTKSIILTTVQQTTTGGGQQVWSIKQYALQEAMESSAFPNEIKMTLIKLQMYKLMIIFCPLKLCKILAS